MTCIKNDNPVYTFNDIEGDVRPVICFGGDNQFVVIRSVEQISGGQSAQLNAKSVVSQSNEIYIHYPVNEGYLEQFSWKNVPSNSNISDDFRDLNIGGE